MRLPILFERMQGFSIPRENRVLVVSYDGYHLLKLGPEIEVESTEASPEEQRRMGGRSITYRGGRYTMLGIHGGEGIIVSPLGEVLDADFDQSAVQILTTAGEPIDTIEFTDLSGDWGHATFSPDGQWLLIGTPYELRVYRRMAAEPRGD